MTVTQNEKLDQVTETTLVVGVDIAHKTQYARAFDWRGREMAGVFRFENEWEGFESFKEWIVSLQQAHEKTSVIVGAEPTGHYWFNLADFLSRENIKLVLVNPFHVKRSKELDDNHPSKSDRKDPKTIAKLVIEGRYNVPYIPEGAYAELRILMDQRNRVCKDLNQIKNRMQKWVSIYFPELSEIYCKIDAVSELEILERAPLPMDILVLGAEGINAIWREARIKAVGMKRAQTLYEAAKHSVGCQNGGNASRLEISWLIQDYRRKMAQYQEIMLAVESVFRQIPHAEKLLEIPGIGLASAAGFLAETGDIRRFSSPKQIQKLAGLALRENSSGQNKGRTTISKRGRARLRTVLFQAVMPLIAQNHAFAHLHGYYTGRAKNPLKKKQSLIALCCKLIRVFYALLTQGTTYSSEKLLGDIHHPYIAA